MADSKDLFNRLKKMFSTDVIVRNVGGKKIKVVDTDEIQYATDRNSLRDRFNRLRSSTYNLHNRDMSMAYQAARLELFRDYDVMDMDPIIASALDIYADECLSGETTIPLMDGRKLSIEELYRRDEKNFWVYSVDSSGKFCPQLCERVAYNGEKPMVKITLCDGTEVKCTKNHIWVLSDGNQVETNKLMVGSSLKAFSTKISSNKFLNGYEMLLENGKWKYTHRLVANSYQPLVDLKNNLKSQSKVIHHTSFDKRNNSPSELRWMDSNEHYKLHAEHNRTIWSDPEKAKEYKNKIRLAHKLYWTEDLKKSVSKRQKKFMQDFIQNMTVEEKKEIFGRVGELNGMFGNGHKLSGNKNGKWKNFSQNIDVEKYEKDVLDGMSDVKLKKKYNISRNLQSEVEFTLRNKWGVAQIKQIALKKRHADYLARGITVEKIKYACSDLIRNGVNIYRKNKMVSNKLGITHHELKDFIFTCQYKGLHDIVNSSNHRVVSIEECGTHGAYDLVNVGDSHIYAIEANDGSKIFTHNCLVPSEFGHVLTIRSQNENIKKILENLFNDILNIEFNLWSWTRNMCKYGDFFLRLEVSPEYGVYLVHPISPYELTRVEGSDPKNINYVKFQHDGLGGGMEYENFEIAHFRLLSDSNFLPYGKSMIEPARRVWKQLSLMEDAMLIHRIMRAPEKRIFSIDVGNLAPSEIDGAMQKVISQVKKVPYIDERTGDYNLRFNLNNMVEDFYLPVRGGDSGTKIDTLPGMDFTGIEDLEYVRNKMMAALKIPKAFLGYDETISGKATLAAEDVRFSRTIGRIQRILVSELTKIAIVHLYVQGYQDASLVDFELELSNPSTIFEQEKIAIWQDKMNVAKDMTDSEMFSRKWIYNKIFNMSSDDIEGIEDDVIKDKKQEWRRQQIKDEGNDPATSNQKVGGDAGPEDLGGGMSDLGGGGGDEMDAGGGIDAAADTGGDAGGGDAGELPPLEEETRKDRERGNRDQTGNKEKYTSRSDKNWGEDPLGAKENKEKSKSDRSIRHTYRGSPLSLEEDLKSITSVLKKRYNTKSKTVITEKRSLLDESNIISEDKPI